MNWGAPCFEAEYNARFYNLRACAMAQFRDAEKQGRVVLPQGLEQRLGEKVLMQGSRLPHHFSVAGRLRYVMDWQEDMRKDGIKSPDVLNAMSFAFLESAHYVAANTNGRGQHDTARGKQQRR